MLSSILLWQIQLVFGSGVFQENIPQSLESRSIVLSYDISHNGEQDRNTDVNLEFIDSNIQATLKFVSFTMNITETASDQTVLQTNLFHTENGTITFDMTHTDGDAQIFASMEPFLNAWIANYTTGTIRLDLPLKPDSTYLIRIGVIGIDSIRGFLPSDQIRPFDVYFSTNEDVAGQASPQTIGQVTLEMLEECEGLGIDAESCTEVEIAEKRSISTNPLISDEQRRLNEERQDQINNLMYMIGIGVAVGAIAFVTLWRRRL